MNDYESAWRDFVLRFGGLMDGVCRAAEGGSTEAQGDLEQYDRVMEMIDEVAEEHGVEGVWEYP